MIEPQAILVNGSDQLVQDHWPVLEKREDLQVDKQADHLPMMVVLLLVHSHYFLEEAVDDWVCRPYAKDHVARMDLIPPCILELA